MSTRRGIVAFIAGARACLVFEPGRNNDAIVTERQGTGSVFCSYEHSDLRIDKLGLVNRRVYFQIPLGTPPTGGWPGCDRAGHTAAGA